MKTQALVALTSALALAACATTGTGSGSAGAATDKASDDAPRFAAMTPDEGPFP